MSTKSTVESLQTTSTKELNSSSDSEWATTTDTSLYSSGSNISIDKEISGSSPHQLTSLFHSKMKLENEDEDEPSFDSSEAEYSSDLSTSDGYCNGSECFCSSPDVSSDDDMM